MRSKIVLVFDRGPTILAAGRLRHYDRIQFQISFSGRDAAGELQLYTLKTWVLWFFIIIEKQQNFVLSWQLLFLRFFNQIFLVGRAILLVRALCLLRLGWLQN
jgi:hypothetical protein